MRARSAAVLAIALAGTWVIAGPAQALEPGVFVDPGSPAGKEYSVPLSLLRGSASGRPANGSGSEPLFGIGISPRELSARGEPARARGERPGARGEASGQPTHGRTNGRSGQAPVPHATHHTRGGRAAGGVGAPPAGVALESLTNHGSSTPELALIGAIVVLGGLAIGAVIVVVRRHLE